MKLSLICSYLVLLLVSQQSEAFTTTTMASIKIPSSSSLLFVSAVETDVFFKAVKVAEGSRSANNDELDQLATELENVDGCKYEEGEDACIREIQDRIEIAQILRLRIELNLRTEYLKKDNLFASDAKKSHDADERQKFRERLQANREKASLTDGSDLGLW